MPTAMINHIFLGRQFSLYDSLTEDQPFSEDGVSSDKLDQFLGLAQPELSRLVDLAVHVEDVNDEGVGSGCNSERKIKIAQKQIKTFPKRCEMDFCIERFKTNSGSIITKIT